jgi:DNA-binding NtrC family response regulator
MSQLFSIVSIVGEAAEAANVGLRALCELLVVFANVGIVLPISDSPRVTTTRARVHGLCPRERIVKEQLEKLVLQMYRSGIRYEEAVQEFRKAFILTVLREHKVNQVRAARELGMHRNTLSRAIRDLEVDIRPLRSSRRRPETHDYLWTFMLPRF